MSWKYGDLVAVGPHLFLCGDVMQEDYKHLLQEREADLIHTDPPWNQAITTTFHKWVKKKSPVFEDLIVCTADALVYAAGAYLFVDMGMTGTPVLSVALQERGLDTQQIFTVPYGSNNTPRTMLCLHARNEPLLSVIDDPEGTDGEQLARWVMAHYGKAGGIFLDLFIGMGWYLDHALPASMIVRGMEINPERLGKCIAKASKKCKVEPVLVRNIKD
jgi:DNA modification methylase